MRSFIVFLWLTVKHITQHVQQQQTNLKRGVSKHAHAPLKFVHIDLLTDLFAPDHPCPVERITYRYSTGYILKH